MSGYKTRFKTSVIDAPAKVIALDPEVEKSLILAAKNHPVNGRDEEAFWKLLDTYGPQLRTVYTKSPHWTKEDRLMSVTEALALAIDTFDPAKYSCLSPVLTDVMHEVIGLAKTSEDLFSVEAREKRLYFQILKECDNDVKRAAREAPRFDMATKRFWTLHRAQAVAVSLTQDSPENEEASPLEKSAAVAALQNAEDEEERLNAIIRAHACLDHISRPFLLDPKGNFLRDENNQKIPVLDYDPDARFIVELVNGFHGFEVVPPGELEDYYGSGPVSEKTSIRFEDWEIRLILEYRRGVHYLPSTITKSYGAALEKMREYIGIPPERRKALKKLAENIEITSPELSLAVAIASGE